MLIESYLVFAAIEQTGVCGVTNTAALADLGDPGWARCVISMAGIASRSAEIATLEQRATMNAGFVFRQLRRRQWRAIRAGNSGHGCRIRVTGPTRLWHTLRIDFRLRIFRRSNSMDSMATHARRSAIVVKI